MPEERDEIILALHKYRSKEFAALAAVFLCLAAETHPEQMREAFGKLFDTGALEDMTRRAVLISSDAQAKAEAARELMASVSKDLEDLERRYDSLILALEAADKRMRALGANQQKFRDAFVQWNEARKGKPQQAAQPRKAT